MNFKTYHYTRTAAGGPWFTSTDFGPIEHEVKIERPIRPDFANRCSYILRGHVRDGNYTMFTGLQATQWNGVYTGDLLLPQGKSFVIAELNAEKLVLHIAEKIKIYPRSRTKVVEEFLSKKPRAI